MSLFVPKQMPIIKDKKKHTLFLGLSVPGRLLKRSGSTLPVLPIFFNSVYDKDNPELCKCFRFKKPSSTPPQDVPLKAQLEQEGVPLSLEEEFSKFNLSEESEKPPLPQDVPLKAQLELEGVSLPVKNTIPPQDVPLKAQLELERVSLAPQNTTPPQDVPLEAQLE